jgi:hypothetical protein
MGRVCTCVGPEPGYPQHQSWCGQPEDDDGEAVELDCDRCGNQGVCPDCDPRRPWED